MERPRGEKKGKSRRKDSSWFAPRGGEGGGGKERRIEEVEVNKIRGWMGGQRQIR
jgi:hypothetical protein